MDDVQKENGYTPIANILLEKMSETKLSPTQYRIVLAVWRYTYGFNRKVHELSLTFLSTAIKCDKRQLQRELRDLEEKKIIFQKITNGKSRQIGFNKHYTQWVGETTNGETTNGNSTNGEIDNGETIKGTIGEIIKGAIGETTNQEIHSFKDNTKDNIYVLFDYYLSLNLMKHRTFTKAMQDAITKAMKDNGYTVEDCKEILRRHDRVVAITKDTEYPVEKRGLDVFFGQKVYQAKHLICSEYEDGGKYYEKYKKDLEPRQEPRKLIIVERDFGT